MEAKGSTTGEVMLRLDGPEALVLFDTLSGWEKDGTLRRLASTDRASGRLVLDLLASFEQLVDEAFTGDYGDRLNDA